MLEIDSFRDIGSTY